MRPPGPVAPPVRPPRPAFVAIDPAARAAFVAHRQAGNCVACMEDVPDLQLLACNHGLMCVNCLQGNVMAQIDGDDDDFAVDQLRCQHQGCAHHMDRNEVGCVVAADQERRILNLYDDTAYNRAHPEARPADAAELAEIAAARLQICPRCNNRALLEGGCNHITCPCGEHFCWLCGVGWPAVEGYNHFNRGGVCPLWGPRPGAPARRPVARELLFDDAADDDADVRPAPYAAAPTGGMFRLDLGDGNVFELDLGNEENF